MRRVLGCDSDLPDNRQHVIKRGHLAPITLKRCPRKTIQPCSPFFRVYSWANKGLLEYQYPPDQLPARYAEAIEVIEAELDAKSSFLMEAAKERK